MKCPIKNCNNEVPVKRHLKCCPDCNEKRIQRRILRNDQKDKNKKKLIEVKKENRIRGTEAIRLPQVSKARGDKLSKVFNTWLAEIYG